MKSLLLGAAAALALSTSAHAAILLSLDSVTPVGSDFRYDYSGHITPELGVATGDQLVIVDFAGYVDGSVSTTLPNVTASISNTLPAGLILSSGVTDDAAIPDLVFTYTGADLRTSGGPFPPDLTFTTLSALSTIGTSVNGSFSTRAVQNNGANEGDAIAIAGNVQVPDASLASAVPEPSTWAMLLTGFLGLGLLLRRRKSSPALTLA
jgi:hypothetical protein